MARTLNRLSPRFVATVTEAGRHSDGGNLYLSVSPNGGRRWVFLFKWQGRPREMGLGPLTRVPLARAREKAVDARALLADGKNPLDHRKPTNSDNTFGKAADDLIAAMEPGWSNPKHVDQWRMTLTKYAAPLRPLDVGDITTEHVLEVLKPLWTTRAETASRLRGRIEAVLDAAKAKGRRSGENPARWRGHLDKLLPPRRRLTRGHHAAMGFDDVPALLAKLRLNPSSSNMALEFVVLTAGRSGEILGARPEEFDFDAKIWRVPASRMKAKRPHEVPLTDRMIQVVTASLEGQDKAEFVFPGAAVGKPLSNMALDMALRRAGADAFTTHGFRSSFRDWAGDRTRFPAELAEAALAHVIANKTEAAYRRNTALERRRDLMRAWGAFLEGGVRGNVVSIAGGRS